MKTKMIFSALFFAFFALTNVATAATNTEMPTDQRVPSMHADPVT